MRWLSRLFFPPQPAADALAERADVLALLLRRQANCETMRRNSPEFADLAADRARQLGVLIDEIKAGRHEGAAAVAASLGKVMDNER